jgi:polyhydroxyalkanoate synthesis repressor PhaR
MRLIKRYPNRKLYDTEAKRYITLAEIAAIIRQGQEVTVVDHTTGEDLTALTLTQVIMEQEKRRTGFLPQSVLTGLIQAGGDTMDGLRRTLSAPFHLARQVDEEFERRLQALISRGELAAEEGRRLRVKLLTASEPSAAEEMPGDDELAELLARHGVPTREEIQALMEQLDALAAKLDSASQPPRSG